MVAVRWTFVRYFLFNSNNGTLNLAKGSVIFIGDPKERILEDYLRILRYFRFNSYYGDENIPFSSQAYEACKDLRVKLKNLSPERIQSEFFKILVAPNARKNNAHIRARKSSRSNTREMLFSSFHTR